MHSTKNLESYESDDEKIKSIVTKQNSDPLAEPANQKFVAQAT